MTVVTSRAYTIQEDAADVDGPVMSGLIPMVDMANHDGKLPPLTAKGIEPDGKNFVVLATAPMRKGAQVLPLLSPLALPRALRSSPERCAEHIHAGLPFVRALAQHAPAAAVGLRPPAARQVRRRCLRMPSDAFGSLLMPSEAF